jgi:hypothetical protein
MSMKWLIWLFLGLGLLFLAIGLLVGLLVQGFDSPAEEKVFRYVFTGVFGGIGVILAAVGMIISNHFHNVELLKERLIAEGNFVWAEIIDITPHYHVHINNQTPFILRCMLRHDDGQTYICKSGYLRFNPASLLPEGKVKVWFDTYDIKKYYVDVEGSTQDPVIEI